MFGYNVFNMIPTIDSSITYGMLFVTGLLTSIHCISMCGSINLVASINNENKRNLKRPILYNLGRIISYTTIGALVGLLGKVISINNVVSGIVFSSMKGKTKILINKIASVLILVLSLIMLNRGLLSLNIDLFKNNNYGDYVKTTIKDGYQVLEFDLDYDKYKVKKKLEVGVNIIEFIPDKEETISYTCWMDMIKNNIKVIDDISYFEGDKNE